METPKFAYKSSNSKKSFSVRLRWFLTYAKRVNAQNGKWKHTFRNSCDVANIEVKSPNLYASIPFRKTSSGQGEMKSMEVDLCLYYAIKTNRFESKTFHTAIKK